MALKAVRVRVPCPLPFNMENKMAPNDRDKYRAELMTLTGQTKEQVDKIFDGLKDLPEIIEYVKSQKAEKAEKNEEENDDDWP